MDSLLIRTGWNGKDIEQKSIGCLTQIHSQCPPHTSMEGQPSTIFAIKLSTPLRKSSTVFIRPEMTLHA